MNNYRYSLYTVILMVIFILLASTAYALNPAPVRCGQELQNWYVYAQTDPNYRRLLDEYVCSCQGQDHAYVQPVCVKKSTTPWATGPSGGLSTSEQFAFWALGSLMQGFSGLLWDAISPPDTSYQQQLQRQRELERERQKIEEMKRQARERWEKQLAEEKEKAQQIQKEKEKQEQIARLLDKMGGSITGGKLEPFKWGTPDVDLKPIGTGRFDTSGYRVWQRLLCASYFSGQALSEMKSGNPEGARFLNTQVDKVMVGEMTDVECKFPEMPQVSEPQGPDVKMQKLTGLLKDVQIKIKNLQDIEIKLVEVRKEKEAAEKRLKDAEAKVSEIKSQAANAKTPEEKAQYGDPLNEALALLSKSEDELMKAKQSEDGLLQTQKNILDEMKNLEKQAKMELSMR